VITPEVEALRHRFGLPGMAILQFAFGDDPQARSFRPHHYTRDTVAYTGTHDNDTVAGWWEGGAGASVRSARAGAREKAFARAYLATDGSEMHWVMIRALLASVADTAIVPLQDVLGLGSDARMNVPATLGRNWRWRLRDGQLRPEHGDRLLDLVRLYDRDGR
jgi:4-alpha-glucanotransferase